MPNVPFLPWCWSIQFQPGHHSGPQGFRARSSSQTGSQFFADHCARQSLLRACTSKSISNGRGVDRPGFGGLQADVPKCHRCVTLVQFMDCRLMAGVDLWRAKLPKVAAEGGIGPPPPSLAASVAAPLEDNYTLRAAKVHSRSRDGSSVGDALSGRDCGVWVAWC
ncbi:hypothetical protein PCANC_03086 [Puccinia coronata f. sp. avenae]|uniref:Uncharacterized protein n=1 Tax=Puccinia coronata f. sp. avenae TaxID=200324 RepID=A0A2N5W4R9_9BASI|nr:hypothetical protein PCANC_03086 [Puccinia coronata f. sp. avenae]